MLRAAGTTLNQPREVALWGVRMKLLYLTGGRDVGIRGGEVGPLTTPDGTHPEVQRVYGSRPLVVPTRITFEGIHFHDVATTSPTAHVDCLQVENGLDLVIRGNRFTRCGSTGLRLSFGADGNEAPPRRVLVEGNAFGACADTPVSRCYYAAQAGTGVDVLVRGNVAAQALQPAGGARYARRVRYVGNVAPGVGCEPYVRYERNVWRDERCSPSDRRVRGLRFAQRPDGTVRAARARGPAAVDRDPGARRVACGSVMPSPPSATTTARVDVVVVAHASRDTLRACVAPLAGAPGVRVVVVDTASAPTPASTRWPTCRSRSSHAERNGGFAYGSNLGARAGAARRTSCCSTPTRRSAPADLGAWSAVLDAEPATGLVAPRIEDERRRPAPQPAPVPAAALGAVQGAVPAPRRCRAPPGATTSSTTAAAYERPGTAEWVSGACMLVRRSALEALGGLDEGFFLYSEDTDLCARLWDAGWRVRFEPAARAVHAGGPRRRAAACAWPTSAATSATSSSTTGRAPRGSRALAQALEEVTHLVARARRPGWAAGHRAGLAAALGAAARPHRAAALAGRPPWPEPPSAASAGEPPAAAAA